MRTLNADVLDKLDEGRIVIRGMMRCEFGTGTYGFWTGRETYHFEGLDYLPGGILEVGEVAGSYGMSAEGLEIRLASAPDGGLTPDILASIEQEDYHQRPVRLFDLYIDPDTRAVLFVEPVYRGSVDVIEHEGGSRPGLVIRCESRALDNSRQGYRMRSNADQQLISPGDRFFEHAEVAGKQEIYWGRKQP